MKTRQIQVHTILYYIRPQIDCFHQRIMGWPVLKDGMATVRTILTQIFHLATRISMTSATIAGGGEGIDAIIIFVN